MRKILVTAVFMLSVGGPTTAVDAQETSSLCAISPHNCAVQQGELGTGISWRPEIEYNICDIWPELCEIVDSEATGSLDLCALDPSRCIVENSAPLNNAAFEALMRESTDLCRVKPSACSPTNQSQPEPIAIDVCQTWPTLCENGSWQSESTVEVQACQLAPELCEITDLYSIQDEMRSLGVGF